MTRFMRPPASAATVFRARSSALSDPLTLPPHAETNAAAKACMAQWVGVCQGRVTAKAVIRASCL